MSLKQPAQEVLDLIARGFDKNRELTGGTVSALTDPSWPVPPAQEIAMGVNASI